MKGLLLLSTILVSPPIRMGGNATSVDPNRLDLLLDAIAAVESRNDPRAAGDGGTALGPYQIHRAYWADATRFLGVDWSYTDAQDPVKARDAVRAYLLHYGRGCSMMEMARIHNGGPNGHKRAATLEYARRIGEALCGSPAARQRGTIGGS
jgi:hypothetical protein